MLPCGLSARMYQWSQGLIGQLSGATTATGPASPRLLTPMTTPRACEATTAALRELIYPSSEDSSQSSANDLLFSQDAAALLARASAGALLSQSFFASQHCHTCSQESLPPTYLSHGS